MVRKPAKSADAQHPLAGRRRLRILLPVAVMAAGILTGWTSWSVAQVRARRELLTRIELAGGEVVLPQGQTADEAVSHNLPWMWRVCGAKPVWWVILPDERFTDASEARVQALFPEARVASASQAARRGR